MNKKILNAILAIVVFGFFNVTLAKTTPKEPEVPPAFVETMKVVPTLDQRKILATGSVIANPGVVIRPEMPGRVTQIFFKPGEKINAGVPIIEINPESTKAELAQAQAQLKLKQLNYERFSKLYQSRTVSKAEFDQSQADLDSAKAMVDQENAKLHQLIITAPFSGRLGINLVNLGDYVTQGQDIVSLQALDPVYVDFAVPEIDIHNVAVNQQVNITSDSIPDMQFSGNVFAIDPLVNVKTRSLNVRAVVPNKEEKLLPGTFAEVTLLYGTKEPKIKVPQTAIVSDATGNYVYKVVDNKAVKTAVGLGERDIQNIIITSGLKSGDSIVTAGQQKIAFDGAPIIDAQSAKKLNKAPQESPKNKKP